MFHARRGAGLSVLSCRVEKVAGKASQDLSGRRGTLKNSAAHANNAKFSMVVLRNCGISRQKIADTTCRSIVGKLARLIKPSLPEME